MSRTKVAYITIPQYLRFIRGDAITAAINDEDIVPIVSIDPSMVGEHSASEGTVRDVNLTYVKMADEIWAFGSTDVSTAGKKVSGVPLTKPIESEIDKADSLGMPIKVFDVGMESGELELAANLKPKGASD